MAIGIGIGTWAPPMASGGGSGLPSKTADPTISGTVAVGEMLTATTGTWTNSPSSYAYVWKRNGTVIPLQLSNTCMVPPNAMGQTITVEVTATNGSGSSSPAASAATASVAQTFVASAFATAPGLWSHCKVLKSTYSGDLIELYMNGGAATKICTPTAQGLLDRADIEAWAAANQGAYPGVGGVNPRVRTIYNQGTTAGAHLVQSIEAYMPILDMNAWRDDGTIPLSFNGFNARDSWWDGTEPQTTGTAVPVSENNTFMQVASGTLAFKTCEHTVAVVLEGLSNVGTSASGGGIGQAYIAGMKATTSAALNNWGLRSGACVWTGQFGLGVHSGTSTLETPSTPLRTPNNRCLIAEMQSVTVTNTIDGFTPSSNAVVNIRVNNDTGQQWTANTSVARTASAGSSGFFSLGRGPTGGGGTGGGTNAATSTNDGTAFGFYAMAYVDAPLSTGSGGGIVDNRSASYASLMKAVHVRDDFTTNITPLGASSMANYAGNAGMGISTRLRYTFGPKVRVSTYAMTSARIGSNILANVAALTPHVISGKRNIAVLYAVAPDIGQDLHTGAAAHADAGALAQALIAGGWYKVFICTFVTPGFVGTGYPGGAPAAQAEVAAFNAAVMNAGNMATYGYTGIDVVGGLGTSAADYLNYHYNDTTSHPRTELTHGMIATIISNAIAADVI